MLLISALSTVLCPKWALCVQKWGVRYHWNAVNTSFFNDTIRAQGVEPAVHPEIYDPFTHRAFGGQVSGTGLAAVVGSSGLQLQSTGVPASNTIEVQVKLLTMAATTPSAWLSTVVRAPSTPVMDRFSALHQPTRTVQYALGAYPSGCGC